MMISTRGRYALRVLIDMAEHPGEAYIPLKEIAEREGISEKYLESIVKLLVKDGLITGLRGKGGGYRLSKSPDQITVAKILNLTEGSLAPVSCVESGSLYCDHMSDCQTLPMWQGLNKVINDYLENYTIRDLMASPDAGYDYVI